MLYKEETSRYNDRRYGKPWIAKLSFVAPGKPHYDFGSWLGQAGGQGELSIEVQSGDVIATGQKDHRKGRGGADHIGVVQLDGKVKWGYTLAAARDAGEIVRDALAEVAANPESAVEIFDPCA
jgi:hypothetical protein